MNAFAFRTKLAKRKVAQTETERAERRSAMLVADYQGRIETHEAQALKYERLAEQERQIADSLRKRLADRLLGKCALGCKVNHPSGYACIVD